MEAENALSSNGKNEANEAPVDFPTHWSGFLERGRPRPLNPPLMQT